MRSQALSPGVFDASASIDGLQTAVVELDRAGAVVFANAAAGSLLGPGPLGEAFLAPLPLREWLQERDPGPLQLEHAGRDLSLRCSLHRGGWLVELHDLVDLAAPASDTLTGLVGRDELHRRIAAQLASVQRGAGGFAVICLDLARFKAVNDTLGHPMGDALLRKVGERLVKAARQEDLVARLGGDEFAILQMGAGQPDAAEALAARLVDLVGRTYVVDGHMLNIGASVGVALAPSDGADAERS